MRIAALVALCLITVGVSQSILPSDDSLKESHKMLEEAKRLANARRNPPPKGGKAPKQEKEKKLNKRVLLQKDKHAAKENRKRILKEHKEKLKREEDEKIKNGEVSRRKLQVQATCNDKEKNGLETDIDCGGQTCRNEYEDIRGMKHYKLCKFAQNCEIPADCVSTSCTAGVCDPRIPFSSKDDNELLQNMLTAFFQIINENGGSELANPFLLSTDFENFLFQSINPDNQKLSTIQQTVFDELLDNLQTQQGLQVPNVKLFFGFLSRGKPFKAVKQAIHDTQATKEL